MLDRIDTLPNGMKTLIGSFAYGTKDLGGEGWDPMFFRSGDGVYLVQRDIWYLDIFEPLTRRILPEAAELLETVDGEDGFWEQVDYGDYEWYLKTLPEVQASGKRWRGGLNSKMTKQETIEWLEREDKSGFLKKFYNKH